MRYRVDLRTGYASFDGSDVLKARRLFDAEGLRLRACRDLNDPGVVIAGLPLEIDVSPRAATWKAA